MATTECPNCSASFTPRRANMKYCSNACAKNGTRIDRRFEIRQRNQRHYDRASVLLELIRSLPTQEHPKFVARLLTLALEGEAGMRNILTDPKLLGARRSSHNIAQRVNELCLEGAGRTSIQILRTGDMSAIEAIKGMDWHPDRCPTPRPDGWDSRQQLPVHLRGEGPQTSSAYNNRPDDHAESNQSKAVDATEELNGSHVASTQEEEEAAMTILEALAA